MLEQTPVTKLRKVRAAVSRHIVLALLCLDIAIHVYLVIQ